MSNKQNTIEHNGQKYILQDHVEEIVSSRLAKISTAKITAEENLKQMEEKLQTSIAAAQTATTLQERLVDLQNKLATVENKHSRYQSIASRGITDNQLVELLEWTYEKSQAGIAKKEQKKIGDWLENCISNPENAPIAIRPHLPRAVQPAADVAPLPSPQKSTAKPIPTQPAPAPKTSINNGALPAPPIQDHWNRLNDLQFYENNRDEYKRLWYSQFKK